MGIAIIGGSFNPPTISHALMGLEILRVCGDIDEVWYLPSNHHPHANKQPHKADRPSYEQRVAWVQAMVNDIADSAHRDMGKAVRLSTIERDFDAPGYAKVVLERLQELHPDHSFTWVIGSDCFENLHTWAYYEWLAEHVEFLVYPRPYFSSRRVNLAEITLPRQVQATVLTPEDVIVSNVSSTFVRNNPEATWAMTPLMAEAWLAEKNI